MSWMSAFGNGFKGLFGGGGGGPAASTAASAAPQPGLLGGVRSWLKAPGADGMTGADRLYMMGAAVRDAAPESNGMNLANARRDYEARQAAAGVRAQQAELSALMKDLSPEDRLYAQFDPEGWTRDRMMRRREREQNGQGAPTQPATSVGPGGRPWFVSGP